MNKRQIVFAQILPATLGVVIPFGVPSDWLKYALGFGLVLTLVGATLCFGSDERSGKGIWGAISLWTLGTRSPGAKVQNHLALQVFFASIFYLAGLAFGAFAAVVDH